MSEISPDQIYRTFDTLEALKEVFLDRIDDMNVPLTEVDAAAGMTRGNMQKCLSNSDAKWARDFGWKTLQAACKGTGLILAAIVDDERFATIKEQMQLRKQPKRAMPRSTRPAWLFTREKAREMGKKRWSNLTPEERTRLARKAGKASGRARRRRARV